MGSEIEIGTLTVLSTVREPALCFGAIQGHVAPGEMTYFRISTDEAERIKTDPARQKELFPVVRPVFQKIGAIVRRHLAGRSVRTLYLVGGTSCFPGIAEVVR